MCDSFNVKKTVNRIKPELFSQIVLHRHIPMNVDWEQSLYRYKQDVFQAYLNLDEKAARQLEPDLTEIGSFANWVGAGEAIIRSMQIANIKMPEEYREDTILNQTAWLYINYPDLWEQLGKFARIDRFGKPQWFLADLQYGLEKPYPDTDNPDLEKLKAEIGPYIQGHQGRGKYMNISFELRNGEDEYYIIDLSDFKRHEVTCVDGVFDYDCVSRKTATIIFVYHRKNLQLEAMLPNFSRREKIELCDIWAHVIKNGYVSKAEREKPIYNLHPILYRDFVFTPDDEGVMVSAQMSGLCTIIKGNPGSKRIYYEKDCSIADKLDREMAQGVRSRESCDVVWVEVKVLLCEKFKRSRVQTVHITPDGHNILDLTGKVHGPLLKIISGWNIRND